MKKGKRVLALLLTIAMAVSLVVNASGSFVLSGGKEISYADVRKYDWFSESVMQATSLGLMIGRGENRFDPKGHVTLAEAVTLAARIHKGDAAGSTDFVQGTPWYQVYVDYALQNGILDAAPTEPNRAATRLEFAQILASALPNEKLQGINAVYEGEIPDVADDASVYLLYRAGVLTGMDEWGTFCPGNPILRSEVAAVVTRMALPEMRESVYLGGPIDEVIEEPEEPEDDSTIRAEVKVTAQGAVQDDVTLEKEGLEIRATVAAGTKLEEGVQSLALSVTELEKSSSVTAGDDQTLTAMDVHMEGVSASNDKAILVELGEILPEGMNLGNVTLYHTENGTANEMTQVLSLPELDAHNEFYYDPATGRITVALATFSEIAVVADDDNAWKGEFDYTWYTNAVAPAADGEPVYVIANADQLAAFGAIVGGMDGQTQDSFKDKTVKLLADINLGDKESENNPDIIFYPIGYHNSEGTYEKTNTAITSGLRNFEGTFDGNGHTIANFYQNTWEMKGDHNWYDATLQYYRDGMGLFGKVYGGTVKNLTVDNFSSDGEITTTGVIAAYADGTTFENIAIFNCNPRVYNIGNGGIVGCVGWYAQKADLKTTFTNITVDNSNKISALWGSYDVACGGIVGQYYPTSGQTSAGTPKNGGVHFENCHISAQMDVYNDVCANYQYYAYRYTGMLIGSVRENETIDGHVYPKMDGITAKDCTVHFGTWNDYYYCEIIDNTTASYTHDYQMSRLDEIKTIDGTTITYLDGTTGTVPASGRANYVIVDYTKGHGTENATCYHFKDGAVWTHDMGGIQTGIDENGDGNDDLKEDKQHIYLEFNNLVTGYGWGVTTKGVDDLDGVTILDREVADSVVKFEGKVKDLTTDRVYTLDEIFAYIENCGVKVVDDAVNATITNLDENGNVIATFTRGEKWSEGTISFENTGNIAITIQDYYFCKETTITVTVTKRVAEEKFDVVMNNGDFLHRVGNSGTVALDKLFKAKDGVTVGTVSVTVEAVDGTSASGSHTSNATWTNGTIQFNGTGVVKVTITDNDYCTPTELILEVVDAKNATAAMSATSSNVVLLNDIGNGFTVSGRYAVYGNGFTLNYTGNGQYLNNGLKQGVVTVSENGTLDNLRIVASIYPSAYMYYGSTLLGDYVQGGPSTEEGGKTRYHYQLSAVVAKDSATISNCYIYGGRNNIFVDTGDVTITDSVLECGVVANVQIQSNASHTVTFENVTTIQYQVNPTIGDTSKVMLGAGVLVGPETTENPKIVLNGEFKQYNWVNSDDADAASDKMTKLIISGALDASAYNHTVNEKTASNLGIIYMNTYAVPVTNNTGLPYELDTVTMKYGGNSVDGQVYSLQGATAEQIYSDYKNADKSTENGMYEPQFKYSADLGGQLVPDEGLDKYCYRENDTIKVMFPSGDTKELDLAALVNIAKYSGQDLGLVITCKDGNGNTVDVTGNEITLSAIEEYTITYTVTDALFYDKDGNTVDNTAEYSWDVTLSVSLKDTAVPNAYFDYDATKQTMGYAKKNVFAGGNTQYLPFLAGLKIYDYVGQEAYLRFDGDNDFNKVASATITGYTSANHVLIEVKLTDGGVINIDTTARAASGGSTYTGKIQTSGSTLYYVNDGTTSATTTTWVISSYKFTGNNGVEIDSGAVTFSNCENGSVPTGSFSTTIKYTVTYDANGGNCGQTVGYATSVSAAVTLPTPTRSGYIFSGWYTAASGGTRVGGAGESYTPTANITLYARWGKPCTVTYNANGGSCGTASEKYTGTALTLPTATRDGYWFIGWYDAAEGGNKIGDAGATYNPSGEITLYAHWQEQVEYTVTYDANSGTCGTASATYQGTALTLPTPTRTGYTFTGWYTAASGGNKVEGPYTPTANITLYAQWTGCVVTYNANGGTCGTASEKYTGTALTLPTPTRDGYTFNGWYTAASGGTKAESPYVPSADITLYAQWTQESSGSCVTPDTLITLGDGTQMRVDELTGYEQLLVWNMETGALDSAPILFVDTEEEAEFEIVHLYFSDGTEVKVIYEHGFWDYDLNRYVYLDRYADRYIGHTFAKQNGEELAKVQLVDVVIETEVTTAWSPVTMGHLCYFVNGMLSMPGGVGGLFNIFEVDPETMSYDQEAMAQDIATYGLFTYEELNAIEPLTEEMFEAAGGAYLKISMGKGNLTMDELRAMIRRYSEYFTQHMMLMSLNA